MKKPRLTWLFLFVALTILSATLLAACDMADDVSYAPVAYGENGHCYYVTDPAEVVDLQQAGLCPRAWTPVIMPIAWHAMYYSYYDSPSYYDRYVPSARRTYYKTTVITKSETTYKTEITQDSSKAKYKGSDGKQYTSTQVKSKGFSSGSARQTTKPAPTTTKKTTSPPSATTKTKPAKPPVITKPVKKSTGSTSTSSGFRSGGARKR
jgi:hypothetical protein